jgi:hypothetical protein
MYEMTVTLSGVVGKKGEGKLQNGDKWKTDRVDLHCLQPLSGDDSTGEATQIHKIQDRDKHIEQAKSLVGKKIVLLRDIVTDGQNEKIVTVGFRAAK